MKHFLLITIAALLATGCSLLRRENQKTVDSGDAFPLYPTDTNVSIGGNHNHPIDGHWFILTAGTMKVNGFDDEDWPYLEFVPTEGRFYGNNGCNILNGSYHEGDHQSLTLSNVAKTMSLCPADSLDYPISKALNQVKSFQVTESKDGSKLLELKNERNVTVMLLRQSDLAWLSGAWQVTQINGKPVKIDNMRLVFDIEEGKINGDTGCNTVRGTITRDPMSGTTLQFADLTTTRMACQDPSTESALLVALEEVTAARRTAKGHCRLVNNAGQTLLELIPLTKRYLEQ